MTRIGLSPEFRQAGVMVNPEEGEVEITFSIPVELVGKRVQFYHEPMNVAHEFYFNDQKSQSTANPLEWGMWKTEQKGVLRYTENQVEAVRNTYVNLVIKEEDR